MLSSINPERPAANLARQHPITVSPCLSKVLRPKPFPIQLDTQMHPISDHKIPIKDLHPKMRATDGHHQWPSIHTDMLALMASLCPAQ